jgi:hypothetical protein
MSFKTVFDPSFKYRRADMTDLRLTFARIRREQKSAQRRVQVQASAKVVGRIVPAEPCHWPFPVGALTRVQDVQA